MPSSSNQKNPCPICGREKTSWSAKCTRCEGNRQRYLIAVERREADQVFLASLEGRTLQQVADEKKVSRQRVFQLKQDALRRVGYLRQHPTPRRAFEQIPA